MYAAMFNKQTFDRLIKTSDLGAILFSTEDLC